MKLSDLESRIKALERKAGEKARRQAERDMFTGPQPFRVRDGFVTACLFIPRDHIPTWSEFASLGRVRATCPDYADGSCQYSDACRSGDKWPDSQTE